MNDEHHEPTPRRKLIGLPSMILLGALGGVLAVGGVLYMRAASSTNQVALTSQPKPVTAVLGASQPFQPTRRYVGTIEPWLSASVGPQMISAYVDTVLVRPGDVVKRGAVLATLDCRNASAMSKVVAAQARAIDAMRHGIGERGVARREPARRQVRLRRTRSTRSRPRRRARRPSSRPAGAGGRHVAAGR